MGRAASSHAKLVATGRAFLTVATDAAVKPLFVARAFAANFDVTLTAKIAALEAALEPHGHGQTDVEGRHGANEDAEPVALRQLANIWSVIFGPARLRSNGDKPFARNQ